MTTIAIAVDFARERYSQYLVEEFIPMIAEHYAEVSGTPDIPVDPDWAMYDKLDAMDRLAIFTARAEEVLIGYSIFYLGPHPHHRDTKQAMQDILYIHPRYREGALGSRLISFCNEELWKLGVVCVYSGVTEKRDFSPVLLRLGFKKTETMYMKRLDREV